ncbi:methyltransferase domain-containing protein [Haloechinothrix salitolerans]|uniref:Methyltransferase domain-containing protein n=1 Tax=Haloechinothrix salitolerans TaxID=926830 RepID=A0ABW2BT42_9PSEU
MASHDGRWSFAALRAGATHVTGIEARKELVKGAEDNFAHYDVDPTTYRFVCGDVFDALTTEGLDVDVVMCLGFLYHTLRYNELFTHIRALRPRHLIVDTNVMPDQDKPVVRLVRDKTAKQQNAAADAFSHNGQALVGKPSAPAVRFMQETYDFEVEDIYDWHNLLAARPGVEGLADYRKDQRVTMRSRLAA